MRSREVSLTSLDGTALRGTVREPDSECTGSALLVHGINSDRNESGFYELIAQTLIQVGYRSLALDFRGHGESQGTQQDFTISGALTDLLTGVEYLENEHSSPVDLVVAASFGSGIAVYLANELISRPPSKTVLFNPRFDYAPWVNESTLFADDGTPAPESQNALLSGVPVTRRGFKLSQCMVNELRTFSCRAALRETESAFLVLHGTSDSVISIDATWEWTKLLTDVTVVEVDGAQHGFTDPETDDPDSERAKELRRFVADCMRSWVTN